MGGHALPGEASVPVLFAGHLCEVLFLLGASALIVRSLFVARTLTFDSILGAVCGYLEDEDAEIRRAAALACAMKDCQDHIPGLIRLLGDRDVLVAQAAHAALRELSGQDLGPRAGADGTERDRAIAAWRAWWKGQN